MIRLFDLFKKETHSEHYQCVWSEHQATKRIKRAMEITFLNKYSSSQLQRKGDIVSVEPKLLRFTLWEHLHQIS